MISERENWPAGQWFALRVDYVEPPSWKRALFCVTLVLRYLGTLGFHVAMFKHPGTVHVIRRTDGAVVTTAHFTRPWEMWWEVDWWEKQLRELTAADFCELLQDPTDSSVGAVPAARGEA